MWRLDLQVQRGHLPGWTFLENFKSQKTWNRTFCLSVYPSLHSPDFCLSVSLYVYMSVCHMSTVSQSVCFPVCLYVGLLVRPSACGQSVCLSKYMYVCMFVCSSSICTSAHPSFHLSICQLSVRLLACLFVCLDHSSVRLSTLICLSAHVCLFTFRTSICPLV
jgi:hypothetical protein